MLLPFTKRVRDLSKKVSPHLMKVALVLLMLWGVYELVGNEILKPIARRQIEQFTGAQVTIADIKFQLDGLVIMKDLRISTCMDGLDEGAIVKAERIEAVFSRTSFLKFKPRLKSLTVNDFTINAQYDTEERNWNFSAFQILISS